MQVILSGTVCMLSENNGEDIAVIKNEKKYRKWEYNQEYLDDCVTMHDWNHSESSHLSTCWTVQEHPL